MKATHNTLLASALTLAATSATAAGAVVSYPVMGYDNAGDPIYDKTKPIPVMSMEVTGYDLAGDPIYSELNTAQVRFKTVIGYDLAGDPVYFDETAEGLPAAGN